MNMSANRPKPTVAADGDSLVSHVRELLLNVERQKGAPLTAKDILQIRDAVASMRLRLFAPIPPL